jgi:PTH1 family peptidyl-tRNA hydrolase
MNVSGGPTSSLAKYYGIGPDHVIAVHDEIDIPFNSIKLKLGGGEGGHNGLRDISKALATKDYLRVRVGVGRPPGRMDAADFVLRDFGTAEKKELPFLLDEAADAVEALVRDGLLDAQQRFHPAKA